ncbi:hypothetical protein [Clostridium tagluense]|uniref:Uncharacterized protein n=1 Tax=Clostridium tagluense TaxID=360422 RepID=A0A401UTP3_9CLOT|nr:hypothetical protein [Clostridium tagluense]GCD12884.1 hypothetical protein Ctaglu_45070 [Clostridium tagluense]
MKKALTLEIWVDETLEEAKECVNEVYNNMLAHEYIDDGSIKIREVKTTKFFKSLNYDEDYINNLNISN